MRSEAVAKESSSHSTLHEGGDTLNRYVSVQEVTSQLWPSDAPSALLNSCCELDWLSRWSACCSRLLGAPKLNEQLTMGCLHSRLLALVPRLEGAAKDPFGVERGKGFFDSSVPEGATDCASIKQL
jgi:hypothetical protein